jgi:hypothetical protein
MPFRGFFVIFLDYFQTFLKTTQNHPGDDGRYADCIKYKADLPITGGLVFLL